MKKLFTLVALLTVFMGAKADWVNDKTIDYSTMNKFPFYVMGYVPEWVNGIMTDYGGNYKYVAMATEDQNTHELTYSEETSDVLISLGDNDTQKYYKIYKGDGNTDVWHQYFIADGITTELGGSYTVKAMVKASKAVTINVNMGWGWGTGQAASASVAIPASDDFVEVEWTYTEIGGTSCNLVAQPNTDATIEWKSLVVGHNEKKARPTVWKEWLTSDGQPVIVENKVDDIPTYMGNAETPWTDDQAAVKFNDTEKNFLICAWSKEKGENLNENDGWDPFPAKIEVDPKDPNNHVFVCHGKPADSPKGADGADVSAWDNQFWIQSPKSWKEGDQVKVHFRYMCNQESVKTNTQIHKQNPSDYLHWEAVGDVTFTDKWQEFDKTFTFNGSQATGWSIAFNLNPEVKTAVDFYFDDLSWQTMVLDEGWFVASSNSKTGIEYDYDNATELVYDADEDAYIATVGEIGKKDTWVNEVMISSIRGNDASFKGATIKLGATTFVEDDWMTVTTGALSKIKLPAAGAWQILLAWGEEEKLIKFVKLDGEADAEPIDIVTNKTNVIVKGQERDDLSDTAQGDNPQREEEGGKGETWDNQFFLVANRVLDAGEETVVKFSYKANKEAKTTTQTHAQPGGYIHWAAIGDVTFTTDWKEFTYDYTIPAEAAGKNAQSIAFNMAEIKEACDYELKDFQWYLKNDQEGKTMENLIDETGTKNFYVKEGAGTDPHEFVSGETGIENVAAKSAKTSTAIYNLAGQRVANSFKGIVIKDGKKVVK
jgi:hypothetical protein